MRTMMAFAAISALSLGLAVTPSPSRAEEAAVAASDPACSQRLAEVEAEWAKSPLPTDKVREAISNTGRHYDPAAADSKFMRSQVEAAERLCRQGKDHEALLRLDVVRAWLKLPFEEHPGSHNYHPTNKAG